jgi:hypothetical protein
LPVFELTKGMNKMSTAKPPIPFPQEPLWKQTIDLIKKADTADLLTDAKAIETNLPFNSKETRERYGRALATRFSRLDESIRQGLVTLAKSKSETTLMEHVWRVLFCLTEPLVAQVYLDLIWPREPGSSISRDEMKSYIETAFQQESAKLNQRIVSCLRQSGYIVPHGKTDFVVAGFGNPEIAHIFLTHLLMAQSPRTIKLSEIEGSNSWRFLGYRKFDQVRVAYRAAEAKGIIMRYTIADHLEQITTRYTMQELLVGGI